MVKPFGREGGKTRVLFRVLETKKKFWSFPDQTFSLEVLSRRIRHVARGNRRRSLLGVPKTPPPLGGVVVVVVLFGKNVASRDDEDW